MAKLNNREAVKQREIMKMAAESDEIKDLRAKI